MELPEYAGVRSNDLADLGCVYDDVNPNYGSPDANFADVNNIIDHSSSSGTS